MENVTLSQSTFLDGMIQRLLLRGRGRSVYLVIICFIFIFNLDLRYSVHVYKQSSCKYCQVISFDIYLYAYDTKEIA